MAVLSHLSLPRMVISLSSADHQAQFAPSFRCARLSILESRVGAILTSPHAANAQSSQPATSLSRLATTFRNNERSIMANGKPTDSSAKAAADSEACTAGGIAEAKPLPATRLGTLLESGKYSDLTLKCGSRN
jgi:hypothetical protein